MVMMHCISHDSAKVIQYGPAMNLLRTLDIVTSHLFIYFFLCRASVILQLGFAWFLLAENVINTPAILRKERDI